MMWLKRLCQCLRPERAASKTRTRRLTRQLQFAELEPRLLLSGNHFDFGMKNGSPPESGYVAVPVVGYDASVGYGWTNTEGVSAVDRATADALKSDFHTAVDHTFQVALPNGAYRVTATMGDALRIRDGVDVYLNGGKVATNLSTQIGEYLTRSYDVNVTNGSLSVRLVDTGGRTSGWALDALDIDPIVDTGYHFDFGMKYSPAASGYVHVPVVGYDASAGYGWTNTEGVSAVDRSAADALKSDFHTAVDRTFRVAVPDGAHSVTLTLGDQLRIRDGIDVYLNGSKVASNLSTQIGQFIQRSYNINVSGGLLNVRLVDTGGRTSGWALAGLDIDGVPQPTTTTTPIGSTITTVDEFHILSTDLLANTEFGYQSWREMASSGAWGANAKWEQGTSSTWHIELQRYGEDLIIGGAIHKNTAAINAGFKIFNWGFARQASDGSFAGTADPFHSTSIFVEAVSHSLLVLQQSPYAQQYKAQIDALRAKVYKAANWMVKSTVWTTGLKNNAPYTHRRYLVASALALTSKLVGGDATLMSLARSQISDGLSKQLANGVNPEKGGFDTSYQTLGAHFAERWVTYYPDESLTPAVRSMVDKALAWEMTMILPTGQVSTVGSIRTGVETGPSGTVKTVDWKRAVDAFGYWYQVTGDADLQIAARHIAEFYYKQG